MHRSHLEYSTETNSRSEIDWETLYALLERCVPPIVYALRIPLWHGQEKDIIDDVIQETVRRMFERIRKGEQGEAEPIQSMKYMGMTIARNYCRDMVRHDHRLIHAQELERSYENEPEDTLEIATERVYRKELFIQLAREVARFPRKQRRALLVDLANRLPFDAQANPLQEAFLMVGISLQEYQHLLPSKSPERCRYSSLLVHAYKRLATNSKLQHFTHERW